MKSTAPIALGLAAACLLIASPAWTQQPYGQYYDYIAKVQVTNDNYLSINVALGNGYNLSPSHGCHNLAFARSMYTISDDRTKAWLQLALASQLSRKKIFVQTQGCAPNAPDYDYPLLTGLQICDGPPGLCPP
jgi:hypothetical protein